MNHNLSFHKGHPTSVDARCDSSEARSSLRYPQVVSSWSAPINSLQDDWGGPLQMFGAFSWDLSVSGTLSKPVAFIFLSTEFEIWNLQVCHPSMSQPGNCLKAKSQYDHRHISHFVSYLSGIFCPFPHT